MVWPAQRRVDRRQLQDHRCVAVPAQGRELRRQSTGAPGRNLRHRVQKARPVALVAKHVGPWTLGQQFLRPLVVVKGRRIGAQNDTGTALLVQQRQQRLARGAGVQHVLIGVDRGRLAPIGQDERDGPGPVQPERREGLPDRTCFGRNGQGQELDRQRTLTGDRHQR